MPNPTPTCRDVASEVTSLVAGDLGPATAAALLAHARTCDACAVIVRRERSLQAWLGALPDAPARALVPPGIPDEPAGRLVRLRFAWGAGAAAAAALVAAWVLVPQTIGVGVPRTEADVSALRVVDTGDVIPAWDDDLLGLVAGAEAVASRRVAEDR